MDKFSIDFNVIQDKLNHKKAYRLVDVQDRIVRVAFDTVKFVDESDISGLWQIHKSDEGEFIVAMYDEPEVTKSSSDWSVVSDSAKTTLSFFYKNDPIAKVAVDSLGIPTSDISMFCKTLPQKLASNKKLVGSMLLKLASADRKELLEKHPELKS